MSWFNKTPHRPTAPLPGPNESVLNVKGFDRLNPSTQWKSPIRDLNAANREYAYIPAEGHLPFVDLAPRFIELMKLCWVHGKVNTGAKRGPVTIGANMAPNFPFNGPGRAQQAPANAPEYKKTLGPLDFQGLISDFKLTEKLERVNAYTFRGEGRSPLDIEAAGGLHPPVTRTDAYHVEKRIYPRFSKYMQKCYGLDVSMEQFNRAYNQVIFDGRDRLMIRCYVAWWDLVERESHHVGEMVKDQALKNFVSTSRYLGVAQDFASHAKKDPMWVFVMRVRGGFNIKGRHRYNNNPNEQEIAFPGPLPWEEVFAFRRQDTWGKLVGPIYMRKVFEAVNPAAYKEVFEILSGKPQKPV